MKIEIDKNKLQPMDMVIFGGKGFNPCCCRFASTGDIFSIFDKFIPIHIGMIIELNGLLFIAESRSGGVQINPIAKYTDTKYSRYIMDIKRHPVYNDQNKRQKVMQRFIEDLYNRVEFDYQGMFRALFTLFGFKYKHQKDKYYCSEYYYHLTKDDIEYPEFFANNPILPLPLSHSYGFQSINAVHILNMTAK